MLQTWSPRTDWTWRSSLPCTSSKTCTPPARLASRSSSEVTFTGECCWSSYCCCHLTEGVCVCVIFNHSVQRRRSTVTSTSTWTKHFSFSSLAVTSFPTREQIFSWKLYPDWTTCCRWGDVEVTVGKKRWWTGRWSGVKTRSHVMTFSSPEIYY